MHAARRLHFDLRFEVDGVLVSWAVPKGPSLDPADKRMAVATEDHPFEYGTFEGVIPAGEYGGGQVIVWDAGTYSPAHEFEHHWLDAGEASRVMRSDIERGRVMVYLRGEKLKGRFSLIRTAQGWLLAKSRDGLEDRPLHDRSVLTGRLVEEVQPDVPYRRRWPVPQLATEAYGRECPALIAPMLAQSARKAFHDERWVYEPKLDGIRLMARVLDGKARLFSRKGRDITLQYPGVASALSALPVSQAWLDGEVVACDQRGRPNFELLQQRMNLTHEKDIARAEVDVPVQYFPFDLLYLDGFDLTRCPLEERYRLMSTILVPPLVPISQFEEGMVAFQVMLDLGMEGVMAKKRGSRYEAGRRSASWLKVKNAEVGEFVVVGYYPGEGSRAAWFGSLVLSDLHRRHVGEVGSGFKTRELDEWLALLKPLRVDKPWLLEPPTDRTIVWVKPTLRVEVRYHDRTSAGKLRGPVYLGRVGDDPLARLRALGKAGVLDVEGHPIALSNLDKELFPGQTKRDLVAYMLAVAEYALPHLVDRPITLTRYPDGIAGKSFYQKHWKQSDIPDFVETAENRDKPDEPWLLCHNTATLVWLAQLANLELHAWMSRCTALRGEDDPLAIPDVLLFDLDPFIYSGEEARGQEPALNWEGFRTACSLALELREMLLSLGLTPFVKTSGKTGLHIFVPLKRRYGFEAVRAACRTLAQFLLQKRPDDVTLEWSTDRRAGKVFLDANQNSHGKSLAWAYSPRPVDWAGVSVPVRWEELESIFPSEFTLRTVPTRLALVGDLWADMDAHRADLGAVLG